MQKKKSGVKKCLEICAIKGGGVGPLMANAILNFHFDFLTPSLIKNTSITSTHARNNAFFFLKKPSLTPSDFWSLKFFVNLFRVVIRFSVKKDQTGAPFTFVALIE